MKALTLHQPWASLIGNPPLKNIENRTWTPPAGILGQRIAIHAGKTYSREAADFARPLVLDFDKRVGKGLVASGAIVATAVVSGCYDSTSDIGLLMFSGLPSEIKQSPWFFGPVGWLLTDVVRLREPIPCKGAQGLWTVPKDIEERLSP